MPNTPNKNVLFAMEAKRTIYERAALLPNITIEDVSNKGTGSTPYMNFTKPLKRTGRVGSKTFSAQDIKERSYSLSIARDFGDDIIMNDEEKELIFSDKMTRIIKPMFSRTISNIEQALYADVLAYAGSTVTGTSSTGLDTLFQMETALNERGAFGDRKFIGAPKSLEYIMKQGRGLFQDASEISKQYKEGIAGRIAQFDIFSSYRIPAPQVGTGVDGSFAVTMTEGSATIAIATLAAGAIKKGQPFTIAGCFEVNEEGIQLSNLKTFRAIADSTLGSVTVQDQIFATAPLKNVSNLISATVAVDFQGSGASTSIQALAFDSQAIKLGFMPLTLPKGVNEAYYMDMDGIRMTYIEEWDFDTKSWKARVDATVGWAFSAPELICGAIFT